MTGPDPRHDPIELGALALGLLTPEQIRAARQHLTGCAMCRREYEELTEMTGVLGELPPEAFLDGPPDGDLVLQRTLRQIRAETGAHRRRKVLGMVAAAAVVVAAIAGGGVAIGRASVPLVPPPGTSAGAVVLAGSGADGVTMRATLGPAASWVRLTASVAGIPAGQRCRILVVARDGSQEVAGSWVVSGAPGGVTLDGSAAVALPDVAAISVQNEAGKEFVRAVV
jgi:anti-sigma factor RsiW